MNPITSIFDRVSRQARSSRGEVFRKHFHLDENTTIIDLGSHDGTNIHNVLAGTRVRPENVYIADIDAAAVQLGASKFGYHPVVIHESGRLPFGDSHFDIVFCSSVIEHVTAPKSDVWRIRSGRAFRRVALQRQKTFASEIVRLGRQYFVQTPYRHFPIESHTRLPFVGWLPRPMLVTMLRFTNKLWIKTTEPDWFLLDKKLMKELFDGARFVDEKVLGLTKSLMAIKTSDPASAY